MVKKTIVMSEETHRRLGNRCKKSQSYEEALNIILDSLTAYEKAIKVFENSRKEYVELWSEFLAVFNGVKDGGK